MMRAEFEKKKAELQAEEAVTMIEKLKSNKEEKRKKARLLKHLSQQIVAMSD